MDPSARLSHDAIESQANSASSRAFVPQTEAAIRHEGVCEGLRQRVKEYERETLALHAELEEARMQPHRSRLQPTRRSVTHKFAIGGHEGYMTVGLFEDNRPGELFLTMAKEGSTIGGLMDTVGILTSLALQYGVSVETLARKFEHVSFEPSGWTGNQDIRRASSVIDYIFRWLGMEFSELYRREKLAAYGRTNDHQPLVNVAYEENTAST